MSLSFKYFSLHPLTNPEVYSKSSVVRSLYIPHSLDYSPYIITDPPSEIINLVFPDSYDIFHPHISFHVIYSSLDTIQAKKHNYVATQLVRYHFLTTLGKHTLDSIYGDVLLFGSFNFSKLTFDNQHYSVPYEVIEQVERIYSSYDKKL